MRALELNRQSTKVNEVKFKDKLNNIYFLAQQASVKGDYFISYKNVPENLKGFLRSTGFGVSSQLPGHDESDIIISWEESF